MNPPTKIEEQKTNPHQFSNLWEQVPASGQGSDNQYEGGQKETESGMDQAFSEDSQVECDYGGSAGGKPKSSSKNTAQKDQ